MKWLKYPVNTLMKMKLGLQYVMKARPQSKALSTWISSGTSLVITTIPSVLKNQKRWKMQEQEDEFQCPECECIFTVSESDQSVRNMSYNKLDDAIQATALVYCPDCGNVVLAIFDSMTITPIKDE